MNEKICVMKMPHDSSMKPTTPQTSLHEQVTFQIQDIAFGGRGIGRVNQIACFTKGVIDGEIVNARVVRKKSRFLEAELLEIKEKSSHRVEAPCPYFLKCGGCSYQHIDYSHQLTIKAKQLQGALERIGGIKDPLVRTMLPSPEPFEYRNRITVHVRDGALGFFVEKSCEVIPIDSCRIASQEVNSALKKLKSQRPKDGDYLLGEREHYGGFRQVNNSMAALMLEAVQGFAIKDHGILLIDAYCGAGFFTHALAPFFSKVVGIEWSKNSVALARRKANLHEVFEEGSVEEILPKKLLEASSAETTLILDPPSEGISELVVMAIINAPPQKIIYVSCNPATLARDIKRLSTHYRLQESTPLDMFPQTAEIESINILTLHGANH